MPDNNVAKLPINHERPTNYIVEAIKAGASVETIEKLMGMEERWESNLARRAFNAAIAAFKADPPAILKNVEVAFGSGKAAYKHEDLAAMLATVDPALAKHGLWVRFKVDTADNKVKVTCIVGHQDGWVEEAASMAAPADTSGSKNPIQAIGSTVTYLQRYTMKAALGLAAAKDDDVVSANKSGTITQEQSDAIEAIFKAHPWIDVLQFLKLADSPSISDIPAVKFSAAKMWLDNKVAKGAPKNG